MNTKNALSVWKDSWSPLSELHREVNQIFDNFGMTPNQRWSGQLLNDAHFIPACDVYEADNYYVLNLEVPGVSKEDIKIETLEDQLVVVGERKTERNSRDKESWYSERKFGKFQRSFRLPPGVNFDKVEAQYQDGVLSIMVPKAESAKPRQIKIGQGSSSGLFGKILNKTSEKEEKQTEKIA